MTARAPLLLIPQHFGSLVFERSRARYLPFDLETTELLLACHRESAFALIGAEVDAARRSKLEAFFEAFSRRGFFDLNGRFLGERLLAEPPVDHLLGPLAVHLEVVAACDLACTHCFAGALPRQERPLTLAELDELFVELAAMGSMRLGLTGGEPLLRRDLFEVIDAALGRGLHPCLITNGLHIDEAIARRLGRRSGEIWLNVSLEGPQAATNDAIRGEGTFERVMASLTILRRHAEFALAFTVMANNADEVEACAQLARDVGARAAVFRPLYPVGTGRRHLELMPSFEQYQAALEALSGLGAAELFSPRRRDPVAARVTADVGCGAGIRVASVSVGGAVNPCSFLGPELDAGSLRERSFRQLWHEAEVFRRLRAAATREPSGGGCRARALALGGGVYAADPWLRASRSAEGGALAPSVEVEVESWLS